MSYPDFYVQIAVEGARRLQAAIDAQTPACRAFVLKADQQGPH